MHSHACSYPAGGGVRLIKDVRDGRGVKGKADKCGKGGGGGPKSRKFCGRPLCMVPNIFAVNTSDKLKE